MKFHSPDAERPRRIDRLFGYFYSLRSGDRFLLASAVLIFSICTIWFGAAFSLSHSEPTPAEGGELTEGILGTPRFINPVLAVTRADRDMAALIYSGLMRLSPEGTLQPDLARSLTISEDGLVYNVILRDDVLFHDGSPLTSEDVAYTISQIQNPALGSPLRASWEGVAVEVINEYELNFVLPESYVPFIENLTVGILPRYIWKDASEEEFPFSQFNSEPIGSGPYHITRVIRDQSGIPESYTLSAYDKYYGTRSKIETITLTFYSNESKIVSAFNEGFIDSVAGLSAEALAELSLENNDHTVITTPLPRTFAVFFNQNKSTALRDLGARKALDVAIDREELVRTILDGYGVPLTTPIPPQFGIEAPEREVPTDPLEEARRILSENGWRMNTTTGILEKEMDGGTVPLAVSIATANTPVFTETAGFIEQKWRALGVEVTVKQFEQSDLTQSVIRPRNYEALLFGTALGRSLDFYSFWHSSQRSDPGLNVSLYANITTDAILTNARTNQDEAAREAAFLQFAEEVQKEAPAVFLYSPVFTYVLPKDLVGTSFTGLAEVQERFANVTNWHIETDVVWPIFK